MRGVDCDWNSTLWDEVMKWIYYFLEWVIIMGDDKKY